MMGLPGEKLFSLSDTICIAASFRDGWHCYNSGTHDAVGWEPRKDRKRKKGKWKN